MDTAPALPPDLLQRLFDPQPDLVFFAKDRQGRYTHANQTLVARLRRSHRDEVLGRTADELFPDALGARFAAQDAQVLQGGPDIQGQLELHLYPSRAPGWCLTHKLAWRQPGGAVIGLVGISRDLAGPQRQSGGSPRSWAGVAQVMARIQQDHAQPLVLGELAAEAGLSVAQMERLFVQLCQLTPRQWLARTRLDAALARLAGPGSVAEIAHACGYADHSAFTRQFRRSTGLSPSEYRALPAQARGTEPA